MFEEFESKFSKVCQTITGIIDKLKVNGDGMAIGESHLREAEQIVIRKMEIDLELQPKDKIPQYQMRIHQYQINLDNLKRKFMDESEKYKTHVGGSPSADNEVIKKYQLQNEQISEAKMMGLNAQMMAVDVVDNMDANNQKLINNIDAVNNINQEQNKGNSIISKMLTRENIMKFVTTLIVGIIVVTFLVIIYFKLFK